MVQNISANILQNYTAFPIDQRLTPREILQLSLKSSTSTQLEEYSSYFHDYLAEAIEARMELVSKEELIAHLKSLIKDDTEEVDNSEEIAAMTNLVAEFDTLSRGEPYITPETLSAATDLEA